MCQKIQGKKLSLKKVNKIGLVPHMQQQEQINLTVSTLVSSFTILTTTTTKCNITKHKCQKKTSILISAPRHKTKIAFILKNKVL